MTKCAFCDKEEILPFTCRYCGQSCCTEHRLPESHNCPTIGARVISMRKTNGGEFKAAYSRRLPFRTSRTEIFHLVAGVLIFFIIYIPGFIQLGLITFLSIIGIVALAFALHELAHKFTAQKYGLWSEFRLDPLGMIISLLTIFMPLKIVAPGAVVIFGFKATKESMGKIALAGPLVNIIQTLVFIVLAQFFPIFWFAAVLNTDLAIFNLIPISILDGQKVFAWSKKAWVMAFAIAIVLLIILS